MTYANDKISYGTSEMYSQHIIMLMIVPQEVAFLDQAGGRGHRLHGRTGLHVHPVQGESNGNISRVGIALRKSSPYPSSRRWFKSKSWKNEPRTLLQCGHELKSLTNGSSKDLDISGERES